MLIVSLPTFHHVAMDVGNHSVGVCDVVTDVGNNHMSIYCKLGLQGNG